MQFDLVLYREYKKLVNIYTYIYILYQSCTFPDISDDDL